MIRKRILFSCRRPVHCFKANFSESPPQLIAHETCGNFSLQELQGRPWKLFLSPTNTAIAHCVSNDFQMDKGIAKQFLKKYGNFNELKKKGLVFPEGQEVGKIGVLETKERFVYSLITRGKWWDPSTYGAIEQCLHALHGHMVDHHIHKLAIPRLGSQHDQLKWDKVRLMILEIFKDSDISITAYTHR